MARNDQNRRVLPAQEPFWEAQYRRFMRLVGCPETAADLFQDLRLKVLLRTRKHGEPQTPKAFVATVARSVFVDWCRKEQQTKHEFRPDDELLVGEVPDPGPDPHERLEDAAW